MSFTLTVAPGERTTLQTGPALLGSDPSCHVRITSEKIHARHATIRLVAGRWMIDSEGEWSIQVGDGVPARKCWLQDNCTIKLADGAPVVTFSLGTAPADMAPQESGVKTQERASRYVELLDLAKSWTVRARAALPPALRSLERHPVAAKVVAALVIAVLSLMFLFGARSRPVTDLDDEPSIVDSVGLVACGFDATLPDGRRTDVCLSTGTCFALTTDGYLLTNRHVVEETWNRSHATIALAELRRQKQIELIPMVWVFFGKLAKFPAKIVYMSEKFDIAILKISRPFGRHFRLSTAETHPRGTKVTAFGFPSVAGLALSKDEIAEDLLRRSEEVGTIQSRFKDRDFEFILTSGNVSRVTQESGGRRWVQHSADINPGNSGGPLATEDGVVVGINTLGSRDASGVYFAILTSQLKSELSASVPGVEWAY